MTLLYPQALLLLLPLGLLLWRTGKLKGPAFPLRVIVTTLLVLALSGPELVWKSAGSDLIVVVDRSKSMPPRSEASAEELLELVEPQRGPGDRLGVVSFGREARVEMPLTEQSGFGGMTAKLDAEASNLSGALDTAGELVPVERTARVLVVSDGRATGLDPRAAARRLAARGIPVDFRWLGREDTGLDVAVTSLAAPPQVAAKEPFQLTASIHSTAAAKVMVTLARQGKVIVKGERDVGEGNSTLTFGDLVDAPGLYAYQLQVEAKSDAVIENDIGRAVVRVEGPPKVLVLTDKPNGTLAKTLAASGLETVVSPPRALTLDQLDDVGAVVLEDVEAGRLSETGLHVLSQFVKEAGGGLVMTGGKHSFGEGGYRKSPVEDLLPVSLEVREEQRKVAIAMSVIMDCSCSMGATVPDGRTKMELAAEGVVGALEMLNPNDEASVHMVDTGPHEIFGMSSVSDGLPLGKVARGFSGGGGIYVDVGLRTAKREILTSSKVTRHVLLFSDAADSENPGDFKDTLAALKKENVTVSVIAMGSTKDPDAKLLEEIAALGDGRIYFAEDAMSLPRIFSQETIAVARSSFVDTATPLALGPDLALLGKMPTSAPTPCGGYNLTYVKPQASVGLRTEDENKAPAFAFWPRGVGRTAALALEVDGQFTGEQKAWAGRRALLEQMVRWVYPEKVGGLDAVARTTLQGDDLHVTLDFDPSQPPPANAPTLVLLSGDARAKPRELPMRWEDEQRAGAHVTLEGTGTWHPVVKLGDRVYRAAPVTLSWAPEFEPGTARDGKALLAALAKLTGGAERLSMAGLFTAAQQSAAPVPLAPALVALALALVVAEVFVRRFFAAGPVRRKPKPAVVAAGPGVIVSTPRVSAPRPEPSKPKPVEEAPPQPAAPPKKPDVSDALEAARAKAKRRTGR
ncbi:MAG: VWA domain-containing protein [Myxococcaceae bacterium]|nr:VWA domain-containing protein [Myxococcaceae bacterium]